MENRGSAAVGLNLDLNASLHLSLSLNLDLNLALKPNLDLNLFPARRGAESESESFSRRAAARRGAANLNLTNFRPLNPKSGGAPRR